MALFWDIRTMLWFIYCSTIKSFMVFSVQMLHLILLYVWDLFWWWNGNIPVRLTTTVELSLLSLPRRYFLFL